MSFKKIRYNLLVIGLIALVGCYIGMSFFLSQTNSSGTNAGGDNNGFIIPIDPDEEEDDTPFFSDNDGDYSGSSSQTKPEVTAKPLDRVINGLKMLNEAKSYNSLFNSTIVNTASIMNVPATQLVKGRVDKGVNSKGEQVYIEENYYYSNETGLAAGFVANYFKGFYTNEATGKTQVGITNKYNYNDMTYDLNGASRNQLMDTASVLDEFKILQGQEFPIKITSVTAKEGKNEVDSPSYKNHTQISINLKSPDYLSQNYVDFYTSSGQLTEVNYISVEIIFHISKKTGKIAQITRKEELTAQVVGMPTSVTSVITTNQYFYNVDSVAEPLRDSL